MTKNAKTKDPEWVPSTEITTDYDLDESYFSDDYFSDVADTSEIDSGLKNFVIN